MSRAGEGPSIRRVAAVAAALAVAIAALPAAAVWGSDRASPAATPASPIEPNGAPDTSVWGWVVVRNGSMSNTPGSVDQGNSTGGTNTVDWDAGLSRYTVTMAGLGAYGPGGSVLVSTFGSKPKICVPTSWGPNQTDGERISIRCYTRTGAPTQGTFVVNYVKAIRGGGEQLPYRFAYMYEHLPTGGAEYLPPLQFDSMGGVIQGDRAGFDHREGIPDLGANGGHVQVSATGQSEDNTAPLSPAVCSVKDWFDQQNGGPTDPSDLVVVTRCRSHTGALLTDRIFELVYAKGLGIAGLGGRTAAYVLADRPTTASYVPANAFTHLQNGGTARITRTAVGRYTIKLPGMHVGGSAQVTPYGSAARQCIVSSIVTSSLPQKVGVRCYDFSGNLRDAKFTLAYAW